VHIELGGEGREGSAELIEVDCETVGVKREFDAHEEKTKHLVAVLVGMKNVGAMLVEQGGNTGYEAAPVGAFDEKDRGVCHMDQEYGMGDGSFKAAPAA
jgi:hypothetical protein